MNDDTLRCCKNIINERYPTLSTRIVRTIFLDHDLFYEVVCVMELHMSINHKTLIIAGFCDNDERREVKEMLQGLLVLLI